MNTSKGFTLVEAMVSVSIFVIVTAIILINHRKFNSDILLTSLAYEMALSIREAQVYGISVRGEVVDTSAKQFDIGYGVHFDRTNLNSYTLFADSSINGNFNIYDDNTVDTDVQIFTLKRGNKIKKFCGYVAGSTDTRCSDGSGTDTTPLNSLDIAFKRPDPEAIIGDIAYGAREYHRAIIYIESPQLEERKITIESTGQISTQQ
ncbi:MAG: prepilin-type N-terminal cleavage/methylation domain-containing protein [bacterium]|nr:prepilin-type N-terminal cleavage/methylation domain-containing protein [bacterium]